jgi:LuxR family maltose regulon positive regulatory protein
MGIAVHSGAGDVVAAAAVRGGVLCRRALFGRLERAGRVAQVSGPAGSGKTVLLRSWIGEAGLADSAAWVSVESGEHDPQRFWVSLVDGLRDTITGSKLVRPLTAAPDLNGWAVVTRLLEDLGSLEDRLWLVIDDLHELRSADALAQLESLVMQAPPDLRFVLSVRQDLRLGLHRLRLAGELTEIRAHDLRFSLDEARALFDAAGAELTDSALAQLHARTEGWAAGLRMAALSLSGHPDPERFAAEFSGSERTVADYLLAEVLDRQSEPARRLLLRTSMCERVNGELADLLTGASGGEQILLELEEAGAFVVSLDAARSWFRYHPLLADLLQLQLRRSGPDELAGLHGAAARWYAGHGHPVEAIRHAHAARDWDLAARLLCDHWLGLVLGGQGTTAHQLLAGFPAGAVAADAELTALMAASELSRGSLDQAERHVAQASQGLALAPAERRGRFRIVLAVLGLWLARQRGDLPAVEEQVQRLLAAAESWLERAQRTLQTEVAPAAGMRLYYARWTVDMACGRHEEALADFHAVERLAATLVTPHPSATSMRAHMLHMLARLGQTGRVEAAVAELDEHERGAEMRTVAQGRREDTGPGEEGLSESVPPQGDAAEGATRAREGSGPHPIEAAPPELLTESETRVLRYLTSHLTASEIAGHLCLSVHTVTTHLRHIYAKLGVHRRCEAVDRARALGLLAPSSRQAYRHLVPEPRPARPRPSGRHERTASAPHRPSPAMH